MSDAELQELVRSVRIARGDTLFYVRVSDAERLLAKIDRLRAIVDGQKKLIAFYEGEVERSLFDDADMPPELLELERAIKAAEAAKEE